MEQLSQRFGEKPSIISDGLSDKQHKMIKMMKDKIEEMELIIVESDKRNDDLAEELAKIKLQYSALELKLTKQRELNGEKTLFGQELQMKIKIMDFKLRIFMDNVEKNDPIYQILAVATKLCENPANLDNG